MPKKLCWICGGEIKESSAGTSKPVFHSEVRLVNVYRPIHGDTKSKPVYICGECTQTKIGLSHEGRNLNEGRKLNIPLSATSVIL